MARRDRAALGIAIASLPFRIALALGTDLSPDEALYLAVARHALPLADHPPLTPWLAALFDGLPVSVELSVRLPVLLLGTAVGLMVIEWVRRRGGDGCAQRWAAVIGSWFALPLAGGFLLTPDAPMLVATIALALLIEPRSDATRLASGYRFATLFAVAAACCLGMLAKVSMVIPAVSAFVATRSRSVRLAVVIGIGLAIPLALTSVQFQIRHAFVAFAYPGPVVGAAGAVAAAIAAQVALWGPPLALGFQSAWTQPFDRMVIALLSALTLLSALVRAIPPEPNWYAPAAVAIVACASHVMQHRSRWLRITTIVAGPGLAIVFATHVVTPWIPIPIRIDPSARLHGWRTGLPRQNAPGVGRYGPAAEACVYQNKCKEINRLRTDSSKP